MEKKALLGLLALFLVFPQCTRAQQYNAESDFQVILRDGDRSVEIIDYFGNRQVVNIPPRINGLPVTRIRQGAFRSKSITSVTIPTGVTSIGQGAFYQCMSLTSITIPSGVTAIEKEAFYQCTKLSSITIPSSVSSIGDSAFFFWSPTQTIIIEGHANQASADRAWGVNWRDYSGAQISYRGSHSTEITETSGSPTDTLKSWLQAFEKGDATILARFSTPESAAKMTPFITAFQAVFASDPIQSYSEQISGNGNTAVVLMTSRKNVSYTVGFIKTDGRWLVSEF